jgi:exosome complex component RRP42
MISVSERNLHHKLILAGVRADGRGPMDYRPPTIDVSLLPLSDGSARCRLGDGTDILVSVKAELGDADLATGGDKGHIFCNVEWHIFNACLTRGSSPSAGTAYEGKGAQDINTELSRALERALQGPQSGIDLADLCIIPGLHVWHLYIDAIVMDYGGNVLDAVFLATRAALRVTRIPKTVVQDVGEGQVDFEIVDDMEQARPIKGVEHVPLCVSVNMVGKGFVVDATPEEEHVTDARLVVSVNKEGKLCALQKTGDGAIASSVLIAMMQTGRDQVLKLIDRMDGMLDALDREAPPTRLF